jgi:hypothetical protein
MTRTVIARMPLLILSIGIRNSYDKTNAFGVELRKSRLSVVVYGVRRCLHSRARENSKSFSLVACISVGLDRTQRNCEPMRKQVEAWRDTQLSDNQAQAHYLLGLRSARPRSPQTPRPCRSRRLLQSPLSRRTIWSLTNALTSTLTDLDPIPQFRATAKLGSLLEATTPA